MTRTERQNLAIDRWKQAGCRNCIVGVTGVGKTRIALMAIRRFFNKNPDKKVVVVVPTLILQDQWKDEVKNFGIKEPVEILVLNTASKKEFECDFLIIDEAHAVCAEQFSQVFFNANAKMIMGLTATYERLDGREKEVLDNWCPVCDTISFDEALQNGWISPSTEYKVVIEVDLTEYNKANQTFLSQFAFFDFDFDAAMKCINNPIFAATYAKRTGYTLSEVKSHAFAWNNALKFRKQFIANHPKKLEVAKLILEHRKDSKAITFNSSMKQCGEYGFGYIVHSGKTKKKNQLTIEEFSNLGPGNVLHSVRALEAGLDVKGLDLAINVGFNSSKLAHTQRVGRVIRKEEGKQAEIFTLVLRGTVEEKWFQKSHETKSFIEINEEELLQILNREPINKNLKTQEIKNVFRF